jgi:protoheme IX farnesyltransferase
VPTDSPPISGIPRGAAVNTQPTLASGASAIVVDYWALTKPEVNFLITMATLPGFYLAWPGGLYHFPLMLLAHTLLGTVLVASGTGTLNQYVERRFDAQMRRTARRPLAAGRLTPSRVLWFGVALSLGGSIYLAIVVNLFASLLAIVTLLSYLFLYTPLKRKTSLSTLVGAFPGAIPPLIGCAAASGGLDLEAWLLYAVLFLWQFPHFMAIAWMYREVYHRAGYLVLPTGKLRSSFIAWLTVLPLLALIVVGLIPTLIGHGGMFYSAAIVMLGAVFLYYGVQLAFQRSNSAARRLLLASIVYLPLVFALMMIDKG